MCEGVERTRLPSRGHNAATSYTVQWLNDRWDASMQGMNSALAVCLMVGLAIGPATAVRADDWMDDVALRSTFAGTTIDGVYTSGMTFRERYLANGRLDYREQGGRAMDGHWSVIAGAWCTIYSVANTGGCFKVRQVSVNCYEFHFQTRTEAEAALPNPGKPSWTARAWLLGRPATCKEAPIV